MLYALLAIAVLVLLVTWLKLNPFIALLISSLSLGAMVVATSGALTMAEVLKAFQAGFGNTLASTGAIIVLGVVFGKLLAESGGAGVLAKQFIQTLGPSRIGLCIILLALCVGMTTWFAVGLLRERSERRAKLLKRILGHIVSAEDLRRLGGSGR
jgi:GntP family gluconate:H+ symporter